MHGPRWQTAVGRLAAARRTYLGLTVAGFPNLFLITGPGSRRCCRTWRVSIEQHVDWVVERLAAMREAGFTTIDATETAQAAWAQHMAVGSMDDAASAGQQPGTRRQRSRQGAGRDALYRRRRPYRSICNEVVGPRHAGLQTVRP